MKKVLLVNSNREKVPYPVPPIGLAMAAAALEGRYEVRLYDGVDAGGGEPLAREVASFAPDYVGVGIRNIDDMRGDRSSFFIDGVADDFVAPLRAATRAPLILGGSGFSVLPDVLLARLGADYGVVGEGEETFPALLAALDAGEDPSSIPGVAARRPDGSVAFSRRPFFDIARLAPPRIFDRLDYAPYRGRGNYPVQTKRGCAQGCLYCTYPEIEGTALRLRSPASVADEIEEASARLGPVTFEFVDSIFNDPPGHAEAICAEIARRGLKVRLRTMGINPGHATDGLLAGMKAAGFAQVDCTPESASPRMLASMRKGFGLDKLVRMARLLVRHEMPTMWFFLFGGPGEDEETVRETFAFIDAEVHPMDMVHMTSGLRVYPRTPLHEVAVREGMVRPDDDLLHTVTYVSPALGYARLYGLLYRASLERPNCLTVEEAVAPPDLMALADKLRRRHGLDEPMFRTLLRLRYQRLKGCGFADAKRGGGEGSAR